MTNEPIAKESVREAGDAAETSTYVCAQCSTAIRESEEHPVAADLDDSGNVVLVLFCDPACKEEWRPERD